MNSLFIIAVLLQTLWSAQNVYSLEERFASLITGGRPAAKGQFPWQVAIDVNTTTHRKFCGGTIIEEDWVLTSAICISGGQSAKISAGITNIEDDNAQIRWADRFILHEEYIENSIFNDIGLIHLTSSFVLSDSVRSITLGDEELPGEHLVITSGWGTNETNSTIKDPYLNYVTLKTIGNDECNLYYGNSIPEQIICGVSTVEEKPSGICMDDSGGPLVANASTNPILVGISTFFSRNGCAYGDPSGFTRISAYYAWIQAVIKW